jgi:hypothetical protein
MRRPLTLLSIPAACLLLSACGSTVATSSFKGTQHDIAQTVANLQSDVTSGEEKKICDNDLAAAVVSRLGGAKACEAGVKTQLAEIDNTELQVETIHVASSGTEATAGVQSIYEGKKRKSTVSLVKQGKTWKISSLQ